MESAVNNFALHLLGFLDYDEPDGVIHQPMYIGFTTYGILTVGAELDICF